MGPNATRDEIFCGWMIVILLLLISGFAALIFGPSKLIDAALSIAVGLDIANNVMSESAPPVGVALFCFAPRLRAIRFSRRVLGVGNLFFGISPGLAPPFLRELRAENGKSPAASGPCLFYWGKSAFKQA